MQITKQQLLTKGVFGIAAVGIVGTIGAVSFAQAATNNTNTSSGYGSTADQAQAALDRLNSQYDSASQQFRQGNQADVAAFKQRVSAGQADADQLNAAFNAADQAYDQQLSDASDQFLSAVQQAANTAESKDQFIDRYNNLKAEYFNKLDAAKNQFADRVSKLGNNSNVAKDQFMNSFNSRRDAYGNYLEQIKNDFANTISNLH